MIRWGVSPPRPEPIPGLLLALLVLVAVPGAASFEAVLSPALLSDDAHFVTRDRRILEPELRPYVWTTLLGQFDPVGRPGADRFGGAYYRPLGLATIAWTYDLAGPDPLAHRLLNLGLHLAVGLALFFALDPRRSLLGAGAAALFFLTHPLAAEVLGFFAGRFDLLAAALMALAAATVWRAATPGRLAVAALAVGAALFTKESALFLLPLVAGAILTAPRREGGPPLVGAGLVVGLPLAAYALARIAVAGSFFPPQAAGILPGPAAAAASTLICLRHVLVPVDLQLFGYPPDHAFLAGDGLDPLRILAVIGLAGLVLCLWAAAGPRRATLAGLGLIGLTLVPLLEPAFLAFPYSDRYLYGATLGVAILLGLGCTRLPPSRARTGLVGLVAGAALLDAGLLAQRGKAFTSPQAFVEHLRSRPWVHPMFVEVLAEYRARMAAEARRGELAAALAGPLPTRADPALALARLAADLGRVDEAVRILEGVPAEAEGHDRCRLQIAFYHRVRQDAPRAEAELRALLARRPELAEARALLGELRLSAQDPAGAEAELRAALARASLPVAWFNLGLALSAQGRNDEALAAFDRAVADAPGEARYRGARGTVLEQLGRRDEAARDYGAAEELKRRALADLPGPRE